MTLPMWDARQWVMFAVAAALSILAGSMYLAAVLRGKKAIPHVVTWALLTALTGAACMLQVGSGEKLAALPLAATTCFNATNLFIGLRRGGGTDITVPSMICAGTTVVAAILWWSTQSAALAATFLTVASLSAFAPTVIRTFAHPEREPQRIYWLKTAQYLFVALAVGQHSVATTLYPAAWFVANAAFSCLHYIRLRAVPCESADVEQRGCSTRGAPVASEPNPSREGDLSRNVEQNPLAPSQVLTDPRAEPTAPR